jgi:hypothetical protein
MNGTSTMNNSFAEVAAAEFLRPSPDHDEVLQPVLCLSLARGIRPPSPSMDLLSPHVWGAAERAQRHRRSDPI